MIISSLETPIAYVTCQELSKELGHADALYTVGVIEASNGCGWNYYKPTWTIDGTISSSGTIFDRS